MRSAGCSAARSIRFTSAISTSPAPPREALGLERSLVVPARVPPHRRAPHASAAHRFAMAALASAGSRQACRCPTSRCTERGRRTPRRRWTGWRRRASTSGDDLLRHRRGRVSGHRDLEGLPGASSIAATSSWCRGRAAPAGSLRTRCPRLAARMVGRAGRGMPGQPAILLVDAPTAPVSSTDVRRRDPQGQSHRRIWCRRPSPRTSHARSLSLIADEDRHEDEHPAQSRASTPPPAQHRR